MFHSSYKLLETITVNFLHTEGKINAKAINSAFYEFEYFPLRLFIQCNNDNIYK